MQLEGLRKITEEVAWAEAVNTVVAGTPAFDRAAFDTYWIEAGHHIRHQVGNDRLLVAFLRRVPEPYEGGSMTLYRGENLNRWRAKSIGFAWTTQRETARMFGSGLNAVGAGGVLLRGTFPPSAIICGPSRHSSYLGEAQFTVDPFVVGAIEELEEYRPFDEVRS